MDIDLLSYFGGTSFTTGGSGFVCADTPPVKADTVMFGGGQQRGLRPGQFRWRLQQGLAQRAGSRLIAWMRMGGIFGVCLNFF